MIGEQQDVEIRAKLASVVQTLRANEIQLREFITAEVPRVLWQTLAFCDGITRGKESLESHSVNKGAARMLALLDAILALAETGERTREKATLALLAAARHN